LSSTGCKHKSLNTGHSSMSRPVIVDAQMTIPMTGANVTEATFFNQIFLSNSGMRFNFDDIREFLHDPLIALIATDLTVP
ncbi:hypothetical protein WUBG_01291, partial [Wuchereria bancrofti]